MQHIRLLFQSPEGEQSSLKHQKRWQKGRLIFIYKMIDPRKNAALNDEVIVAA